MKYIYTVIILLIASTLSLFGQNLVPNAGFEIYIERPLMNLGDLAIDSLLPDWNSPTKASPDFYVFPIDTSHIGDYESINMMEQRAFEGNVFVGLLLQICFDENAVHDLALYREFIQARLKKPLKKGRKYFVSMHYKLSERSTYGIDGLGLCFSKEKISNRSYTLSVKPQIANPDGRVLTNTDWERLTGYVIPHERVKFITIGNFKKYNNTWFKRVVPKDIISSPYSYYLIDNIQVYEVNLNDTLPNVTLSDQKLDSLGKTKDDIFTLDTVILPNNYNIDDTLELSDVLFEFGRASLLKEFYSELLKVVNYLSIYSEMRVEIAGHTDSAGNDIFNLNLSEGRARSVAKFLIENGIETNRITVLGFGETKPVCEDTTETGRAKNRRVEIIFKGHK